MTHDERIEAMAIAMMEAEGYWADEPDDKCWMDEQKPLYRRMAEAALAAADVEGMVREAAREAWDLGCMSETSDIEQRNQDAEEIVREVMGK
jgi:hypothetical protein